MHQLRSIGLLVLAMFLGGCVTGTRTIDLVPPDHPDSNAASGEVYIGTITDNRTFEQKPAQASTPSVTGVLEDTSAETLATLIGRQRNGYGKAMGDVALPPGGTIQQETRDLLAEGLESRGYKVTGNADAPTRIDVSVDKFWGWFRPGMWVVAFETDIQTTLDIASASGTKQLEVKGHGTNRGQVASDANWKLAFDRGFADFLEKLDAALEGAGL